MGNLHRGRACRGSLRRGSLCSRTGTLTLALPVTSASGLTLPLALPLPLAPPLALPLPLVLALGVAVGFGSGFGLVFVTFKEV